MKRDIITSAIGIVVLTLLCGILFPLVITGISQVAFPGNANGQKIYVNGKLAGSKIIGQSFTLQVVKNGKPVVKNGVPVTTPDPRYFQGRPSATVPPNNAAATTFSNLGPNNVATEQAISSNIQAYLALEKPYDPRADRGQGPRRRRQHVGVGDRSRHLGGATRTSRPTASPRSATCRCPRSYSSSRSTPTAAVSGSPESRASTYSSSTWPSTA